MKLVVETALERIRDRMPPQVFRVVVQLMHWADMMDNARAGRAPDLEDVNVMTVMLAPFTGFGEPHVWGHVGGGVTLSVVSETMDWLMGKEQGLLTHRILIRIVPAVVAVTENYEKSREVAAIIMKTMEQD